LGLALFCGSDEARNLLPEALSLARRLPDGTGYGNWAKPLAVLRIGATMRLALFYRASVPWTLDLRLLRAQPDGLEQALRRSIRSPAAETWQRQEFEIAVPADVCAISPSMMLQGRGELSLDQITLEKKP